MNGRIDHWLDDGVPELACCHGRNDGGGRRFVSHLEDPHEEFVGQNRLDLVPDEISPGRCYHGEPLLVSNEHKMYKRRTYIKAYGSKRLDDGNGTLDVEGDLEYVQRCSRCTQRLNGLTNDLADTGRVDGAEGWVTLEESLQTAKAGAMALRVDCMEESVSSEDDLTTSKDGEVALSLDLMWVKSEGMEGMMNDGAKARSLDLKVE